MTEVVIMQNAKSFNDYYNEISCKFLEEYCDKNKDENIVFSPYSIISLLSMIAESTAGDTNICFRKLYGIFNRNF